MGDIMSNRQILLIAIALGFAGGFSAVAFGIATVTIVVSPSATSISLRAISRVFAEVVP